MDIYIGKRFSILVNVSGVHVLRPNHFCSFSGQNLQNTMPAEFFIFIAKYKKGNNSIFLQLKNKLFPFSKWQ